MEIRNERDSTNVNLCDEETGRPFENRAIAIETRPGADGLDSDSELIVYRLEVVRADAFLRPIARSIG